MNKFNKVKVTTYKYYVKLPVVVSCDECGHNHIEWERKGFIKTGEIEKSLNEMANNYLDQKVVDTFKNGFGGVKYDGRK